MKRITPEHGAKLLELCKNIDPSQDSGQKECKYSPSGKHVSPRGICQYCQEIVPETPPTSGQDGEPRTDAKLDSLIRSMGNGMSSLLDHRHEMVDFARILERDLDAATSALAQHKAAAGFCEKHQPTGGHRNCLVCGCERLSFALHQICAAIENDPDTNSYGLYYDEENVVKQVREVVSALAQAREERDAYRSDAEHWQQAYTNEVNRPLP